ncbi:MAG: polysaccharide biosynthesis C-terminal domain-containing protein, partial [Oscillospiraceae bacterium]|nr:polysaccharide biosynthesis C-terminal domain-containing protein [Oscillospiraceae bacterium]
MKQMRKYMANAAYISIIVCVLLTAATVIGCRPLLRLMQTPEEILNDSSVYLTVIFAGLAATILYNLLAGFLRAMGDSTTPLVFLALSSVLNIGLDFAMIMGLHLGVMGAALATVIAQAISAVCCLYFMFRRFDVLAFEQDELPMRSELCGKLCGISLPMAFQFSITAIGSIIMQAAINGFGPEVIASVSTAQKIQNIVGSPMESLGITMATYCGQNLGAKRIDRIREGLRSSTLASLVYAAAAYAFVYFLGKYFVYLFLSTDDPAFAIIMEYAVKYLRISGLFYPVLAVLFVLRNSLQGMGYSLLPMSAGILELVARVAAALFLVTSFGFTGVCLASPVAWVAADVLLVLATVWAMYTLPKRVPNGLPQ